MDITYFVELPNNEPHNRYRSNIYKTLNYYKNTLHLSNPKFLAESEIFAYFISPFDRPSNLKGVDLIIYSNCTLSLDDSMYDFIMYAIEEEVNSLHIALIDIDYPYKLDDADKLIRYVIKFNQTRDSKLRFVDMPYIERAMHGYPIPLQAIETTKGMFTDGKYIPRKFLDYYKSLTMHAFDINSVLLL